MLTSCQVSLKQCKRCIKFLSRVVRGISQCHHRYVLYALAIQRREMWIFSKEFQLCSPRTWARLTGLFYNALGLFDSQCRVCILECNSYSYFLTLGRSVLFIGEFSSCTALKVAFHVSTYSFCGNNSRAMCSNDDSPSPQGRSHNIALVSWCFTFLS